MIKDITIGQYVPGNSAVHRLDPRTKLILALIYIVSLFVMKGYMSFIVMIAFTLGIIHLSGVPFGYILRGLKPILVILSITALLNVFMTPGETVFKVYKLTATKEGIILAVLMMIRLVLLIMGTSVLTLTTTPIALTDAIESLLKPFKKIGVPAHELAMMMTIAIRFIPTLVEETQKIIKAQTARGADFSSGSIIKRAKAMIPILIPLFISAFKRADELAMAMECRCYTGGEGRTRLKQLRFTGLDIKASAVCICIWAIAFAVGVINI